MRINIRIKIKGITFFGMISKTQTLRGISSRVGKDEHLLFWDMENCTLEECENELYRIQVKYILHGIYIWSDKEGSYRAICYTRKPLKEYLHILTETEFVDWNFIWWTTQRGSATLRFSDKEGRKPMRLMTYLIPVNKEKIEIPVNMEKVLYDTGVDKIGKTIVKVVD